MSAPIRRVSDLSLGDVRSRLRSGGLRIQTGPFIFNLHSRRMDVADALATLYSHHPVSTSDFADFHIAVERATGWRGVFRPQAVFWFDHHRPFRPLPLEQAFAMLEWGMNWAISAHAHQYLILHAAAVEKGGRAAILPAPPGSGKSTLCAALVHRGWRLLSDELALIRPHDGRLVGLARPVNLKNSSIDVITAFAPDAVFGPRIPDTSKGTISHLRAPAESVARVMDECATAWVVFPRWEAGAALTLESRPKAQTFLEIAQNAFNYSILGSSAFDTVGNVIEQAECLSLKYSKLDDAVEAFDRLSRGA